MTKEEKARAEKILESLKPKTSYENFIEDVLKYLESKLEPYSIPTSTFQEIAEFFHCKAINYSASEIHKYIKEYQRQQRMAFRTRNSPNNEKGEVNEIHDRGI